MTIFVHNLSSTRDSRSTVTDCPGMNVSVAKVQTLLRCHSDHQPYSNNTVSNVPGRNRLVQIPPSDTDRP